MPTVLIVDDHPSFRACARAVLEADGFEVVGESDDAASALAAARRLHPDIVLLDVQLPDGDGFGVCDTLCHGADRPLVVLVSSRDRSDYGEIVERCGAVGFLAKDDLSGAALSSLLS